MFSQFLEAQNISFCGAKKQKQKERDVLVLSKFLNTEQEKTLLI